jgi:hypothetical protein
MLKLNCREACSYGPNASLVRAICAAIWSGEPIQAAPLAIWSAAVVSRNLAIIRS